MRHVMRRLLTMLAVDDGVERKASYSVMRSGYRDSDEDESSE